MLREYPGTVRDTQGCSRAIPAPEAGPLYLPHPGTEMLRGYSGMLRDTQGCSRDALGLSQLLKLNPSISPTPMQGHSGMALGPTQPKYLHLHVSLGLNPCCHPQHSLPQSPQAPSCPQPSLLTPSSCRRQRGTGCCRGSPRPHGSHWLRSRCCAPTHSCCLTRTSAPQRASWSPRAWGWAAPPPP